MQSLPPLITVTHTEQISSCDKSAMMLLLPLRLDRPAYQRMRRSQLPVLRGMNCHLSLERWIIGSNLTRGKMSVFVVFYV
jgi:hypothetical protein